MPVSLSLLSSLRAFVGWILAAGEKLKFFTFFLIGKCFLIVVSKQYYWDFVLLLTSFFTRLLIIEYSSLFFHCAAGKENICETHSTISQLNKLCNHLCWKKCCITRSYKQRLEKVTKLHESVVTFESYATVCHSIFLLPLLKKATFYNVIPLKLQRRNLGSVKKFPPNNSE